jgi:colicin import membrane protein
MANAALVHDALLPSAPGGTVPGAALALLVHAGLLLALTVSVDWKTSPPDVVSAELWAAVPQAAAPPPPLPAPPPFPAPIAAAVAPAPPKVDARVDAQIAIERAEKLKAAEAALLREQQRVQKIERETQLEAERNKQQAAADKLARETSAAKAEKARVAALAEQKKLDEAARENQREAKAEEARLAQQREANLQRMMGQAGAGSGVGASAGTAAQDAAPSAAYSARLVALIRSNTVFTGSVAANAAAEVEVRAAAGGTIIARRLLKTSGNKEWDEAVLRALDRTAVLPRDSDGRVPPTLIISFRPRE